jgi:hypothetical protein
VIAHPTGVTEIDEARCRPTVTASTSRPSRRRWGWTGSAKEVTALRRLIRIRGPELSYTLLMGAVGVPLVRHLEATLHRQAG